jgi:Calcineurin-like phosphoesterase
VTVTSPSAAAPVSRARTTRPAWPGRSPGRRARLVRAVLAMALAAGCSAAQPPGGESAVRSIVTAPPGASAVPGAGPTPAAAPTSAPPGNAPSGDALLVAAGDIACPPGESPGRRRCAQQATADAVTALAPDAVLALGDLQYEDGSPDEFAAYDASWGAFKQVTLPVAGNHEYHTRDAKGWFGYFGDRVGPGWYAADVGSWRVLVLDTECEQAGGCGPGSPQGRWLADQLGGGGNRCLLAAFHRPRFSSGDEHGSAPELAPLWRQLQRGGVDVILNGHDHDYERFAAQDADGHADASGPVEFVVGTGGKDLRGFRSPVANSAARFADAFGVLALTLRPGGYAWRFVTVPGGATADSGTGTCREQ